MQRPFCFDIFRLFFSLRPRGATNGVIRSLWIARVDTRRRGRREFATRGAFDVK
jgi:hypothetical protein